MSEVPNIFDPKEADKIRAVEKSLNSFDETRMRVVKNILDQNNALKENAITFDNIKKAQKGATETTKELDKIGQQLLQTEQKLKDLEDKRSETITKNKQLISERNKQLKDEAILNNKNAGTLEKLAAKNRILEREKKKLNTQTKNGQKRLKEINIEQDKNNKLIQESSNKLQKQKINIGNYGSALQGAGGALGAFANGMKALLANPVVLIIAGIVTVFAKLKDAFESSERGRGILAKGLGLLKGIGQVIFNIFSKLGETVIDVFENPQQAIRDLWAAIKENIVNRFTGLIDLFKAVGNGLKALWERDMNGLKNAAKEAGTAIIQMGTGLDELQQKKAVQILNDQLKESGDLITASIKLQERELQLRIDSINFITKEAELNKEIASLRKDATDQTISAIDRLESIAKIEEYMTTLFNEQAKLKKEELEIVTLRNSLGKNTLDDTEKEKQLSADIIKIEEQRASEQRTLIRLRTRALDQLTDESINKALEDRNKLVQENQKLFASGVITLETYRAREKELTETSLENQIKALNDILNETEVTAAKRIIIQRQIISLENELIKKQTDEKIKLAQAENDAILNERIRQYEQQKLIIEATTQDEEEKANKIFLIESELIQDQIDSLYDLLATSELTGAERIKIEEAIANKQLELNKITSDDDKRKLEQKKSDAAELQDFLFELGTSTTNAIFEFGNIARQKELENIENQKKAGVISEEAAAKEIAKIKTEQAKADRNRSLFNIAINTAEAILKVTAQTGVLSPFVIPGIIALGAIQAAVVAGTPIPEFATGTDNAPERGIMGDAGRELFFTKSGKVGIAEKPTYFEGSEFKGMTIKTNKETEQILSIASGSEYSPNINLNNESLLKEIKGLRKDIKSKNTVNETKIKTIGFPMTDYQMKILERDRKNV